VAPCFPAPGTHPCPPAPPPLVVKGCVEGVRRSKGSPRGVVKAVLDEEEEERRRDQYETLSLSPGEARSAGEAEKLDSIFILVQHSVPSSKSPDEWADGEHAATVALGLLDTHLEPSPSGENGGGEARGEAGSDARSLCEGWEARSVMARQRVMRISPKVRLLEAAASAHEAAVLPMAVVVSTPITKMACAARGGTHKPTLPGGFVQSLLGAFSRGMGKGVAGRELCLNPHGGQALGDLVAVGVGSASGIGGVRGRVDVEFGGSERDARSMPLGSHLLEYPQRQLPFGSHPLEYLRHKQLLLLLLAQPHQAAQSPLPWLVRSYTAPLLPPLRPASREGHESSEVMAICDRVLCGPWSSCPLELFNFPNDPLALATLARCYDLGQGIKIDLNKASELYQCIDFEKLTELAEQGVDHAQYNLGRMLDLGRGGGRRVDHAAAAQWYLRAVKSSGHPAAQNNLAVAFELGEGMEQNTGEALKFYRSSVARRNTSALCNLGLCYEKGTGVKANSRHAVRLYRLAAAQGNPAAQFSLGTCYEHGRGVAKNYQSALAWYRKAASQGHISAVFNLALSYAEGRGLPEDPRRAVALYRSIALQGDSDAAFNLAVHYAEGTGVPQDYSRAALWYRRAADKDNPAAMCNLGCCFSAGNGVVQDEEQAVQWYLRSAEAGNAQAMLNLGFCFAKGNGGLSRHDGMAVKWYRRAADRGNHAGAQFSLGLCYEKGTGVREDQAEASRWYRQAARQGHAGAQCNLGVNYHFGRGVDKDNAVAADFFRLAAEQGHVMAQSNLGVFYAAGFGVDRDPKNAGMWYKRAAEQGHASSQYQIGNGYANGTLGLPKNEARALAYYRRAALQGHVQSQAALASRLADQASSTQGEDGAAADGVPGRMHWVRIREQRGDQSADKTAPSLRSPRASTPVLKPSDKDGKAPAGAQAVLQKEKGTKVEQEGEPEWLGWLRKAADQGDANAQLKLGKLYETGSPPTIPVNHTLALDSYRRAAVQSRTEAQCRLGTMLILGMGGSQDLRGGLQWLRCAAENKSVEAQYQLGLCFLHGTGVRLDSFAAVHWLSLAADKGHHLEAQALLGTILAEKRVTLGDERERQGIERLHRAAEKGSPTARQNLAAMLRMGDKDKRAARNTRRRRKRAAAGK